MNVYTMVTYTIAAISLIKNFKSSYDAIVWAKHSAGKLRGAVWSKKPEKKKTRIPCSPDWELVSMKTCTDLAEQLPANGDRY